MAPETNPEELLSDDRPIETASTVPPPPSAPTERPKRHRLIVELLIEGEGSDVVQVVNEALDGGALQDAINDHELDAGSLRVVSAAVSLYERAPTAPMTVADLHAGVTTAVPSMHEVRSVLANAANAAGRLSRRAGAPVLDADSSRETLIAWLSWNDPNGAYTDEACVREGEPPLTLEGAWDQLAMVDLDHFTGGDRNVAIAMKRVGVERREYCGICHERLPDGIHDVCDRHEQPLPDDCDARGGAHR